MSYAETKALYTRLWEIGEQRKRDKVYVSVSEPDPERDPIIKRLAELEPVGCVRPDWSGPLSLSGLIVHP